MSRPENSKKISTMNVVKVVFASGHGAVNLNLQLVTECLAPQKRDERTGNGSIVGIFAHQLNQEIVI